ncbi:hypothetical protein DE4585_00566 [Mycobacteroides salmoniphilum]|uniref:Uncharacterized protein n=1 Tax=Mycobacteroides salmoniphilum TaxID=404941 RepID=A0A4V3HYT9_9MYCO|nr:hypothetical protein DE4586_00038 [Mycobacteroides salmoniphilum]TDZ86199.1 hypothetical protein DE4587_02636 [Mycobacteroides salmoniphilum]TDZ86550.1 hypothetical protein DE4585_00566 [Mycobacteroides salmoniphilum]
MLLLLSSAVPDSRACGCADIDIMSADIRDISPPGAMIIGEGCVGAVAASAVLDTP